jgi:hypothetical protein
MRIAFFWNEILFDNSVHHIACYRILFHHDELLKDYDKSCKDNDEFFKEGYVSFIQFNDISKETDEIFKQWNNQRYRNCVLIFCNCEVKKRNCEMDIRICENEKHNCEINKSNCVFLLYNCEIKKHNCENENRNCKYSFRNCKI